MKLERIENPTIVELAQRLADGNYERVFFAEGDSWFDIWTPRPYVEPNLLDAIETKWRGAVVDTAHIGDKASEMVGGRQAANTVAMLDTFAFSALLLSAGGNDLKDAFRERYLALVTQRHARKGRADAELENMVLDPSVARDVFDDVTRCIITWIGLRNQSKKNALTPIILHAYDYFQPRPSPARYKVKGLRVGGPWIHPVLKAAGQTSPEMYKTAKKVIDTLNERLATALAPFPNVQLIDVRKTLTAGEEGSQFESNDWMDEIHPTPAGFAKLGKLWTEKLEAVAIAR